jgi:hypothetical protein
MTVSKKEEYMSRQQVSSGSPYEPRLGISRAVRIDSLIAIAGTAPIGPDGKKNRWQRRPGCPCTIKSGIKEYSWKLSPSYTVVQQQ